MRKFSLRACAAGAAVATLGIAAPATAAGITHVDPRGDITKYSVNIDDSGDLSDQGTFVPDPKERNGDITRFAVAHAPQRVYVRLKMVDLHGFKMTETSGGFYGVFVDLVTGRGRRYEVSMDTLMEPGHREWSLTGDNGDNLRCPGWRHSYDATTHTMRASVPRSCLGSPRKIKAGAGVASMKLTQASDQNAQIDEWVDDALRRGIDPQAEDVTMSRWLRRG